ncbi:MAG: lysophospholipid acyltransferase family protein [Pseudomonadota bacterium]
MPRKAFIPANDPDFYYRDPVASRVALYYERMVPPFARYHRHSVVGGDNLPQSGRCLLVVNHSLATYDTFILSSWIHRHRGRLARSLGDNFWFKLPGFGEFAADVGAIRTRPDIARELLEDEQLLLVAPGGMREALKPSYQKNQLLWDSRKGFVRLAVETQTPIVLAACPEADDIYTVYENRLTKWVYKKFRLPVLMMRGLGPSWIPRPVKLTHYLSEPLYPPKVDLNDHRAVNRAIDEWHDTVKARMEQMLAEHAAQ